MNRYSKTITQPKAQGASQVGRAIWALIHTMMLIKQAMLYATEGVSERSDLDKAMVGVASIWYEGNPCNGHLLALGQRVKQSIMKSDIIGYQFGAVGVSDGISMGTAGSEL